MARDLISYSLKPTIPLLPRPSQSAYIQLKTWTGFLNSYREKIGKLESSMCGWCSTKQTPTHLLLRCRRYKTKAGNPKEPERPVHHTPKFRTSLVGEVSQNMGEKARRIFAILSLTGQNSYNVLRFDTPSLLSCEMKLPEMPNTTPRMRCRQQFHRWARCSA